MPRAFRDTSCSPSEHSGRQRVVALGVTDGHEVRPAITPEPETPRSADRTNCRTPVARGLAPFSSPQLVVTRVFNQSAHALLMLPATWRNLRPDIFSFNDFGRDAWVAQQAALLPPGSRVLD